MDADGARQLAEVYIARWNSALTPDRIANPRASSVDLEDTLVVTRVDEHSRAWIISFASRRWMRTRAFGDRMVGMCPLVVDKVTGDLHVFGSGPDEYEKFRTWIDDPDAG